MAIYTYSREICQEFLDLAGTPVEFNRKEKLCYSTNICNVWYLKLQQNFKIIGKPFVPKAIVHSGFCGFSDAQNDAGISEYSARVSQ